jgi:hypothetical protein
MVSDGMAFFTAQVQAQINKRKSGYTPIIDDARQEARPVSTVP